MQTRQILRALSQDRNETADADMLVWQALQRWLATAEHRVIVPYASALAEQIPPVAVRLRRDFTTLLTLIKAHAVLHQVTRARDSTRRIIATLADYRVVRELVQDLFEMTVQMTVSDAVRETVAAVDALSSPARQPVSLGAVVSRLKLDKSSVSRRVKVAISDGYLTNLENGRGKPMKLVIGDPLPDAQKDPA